jgi:4-carboxymuconolactone decarboxylase
MNCLTLVRNHLPGRLVAAAYMFAVMSLASGQQPRFPQLKLEDTSGEQRAMAERMLKETRVGLGGPWNIMLRSPGMAEGMIGLYNHFRWNSALPTRLVELAIMMTARQWPAPYEWYIHYPLAVKAGVAPEVLADVRAGRRPSAAKPDEVALYEFAIELLTKHTVSDAAFEKAKASLSEKGVVDLTALVGTYAAIGGLLNVAEVAGPPGTGPEYLPRNLP